MKGQMTIINAVMILITLLALAFIAGLFFPIMDNILLPSIAGDTMATSLSYLIFPLLVIGLIVIIWLWARPIVGM